MQGFFVAVSVPNFRVVDLMQSIGDLKEFLPKSNDLPRMGRWIRSREKLVETIQDRQRRSERRSAPRIRILKFAKLEKNIVRVLNDHIPVRPAGMIGKGIGANALHHAFLSSKRKKGCCFPVVELNRLIRLESELIALRGISVVDRG